MVVLTGGVVVYMWLCLNVQNTFFCYGWSAILVPSNKHLDVCNCWHHQCHADGNLCEVQF